MHHEWATHFRVGDSAATMRLTCGMEIRDSNWTQNPGEVTCPACKSNVALSKVLAMIFTSEPCPCGGEHLAEDHDELESIERG